MITKIKHSMTVRGKDAKNPLPDTPANVENGRVAFSHYCGACHGLDGQNTGVPFADRMSPPVPPLNSMLGAIIYRWTTALDHRKRNFSVRNAGVKRNPDGRENYGRSSFTFGIYRRLAALGEPAMYSGDENAATRFNPTGQHDNSGNTHSFGRWNCWAYRDSHENSHCRSVDYRFIESCPLQFANRFVEETGSNTSIGFNDGGNPRCIANGRLRRFQSELRAEMAGDSPVVCLATLR